MTAEIGIYELAAAPAVLALAFVHARRALGGARAAAELLALALYGYALEWVVIRVFASHTYGPGWRLAPGGVPVAVAAVWAAVIVSALALAARHGHATAFGRAATAALLGISLDLLMEPVAVRVGLWTWTPPGSWLGVPVGNFVGWAVIVGTWAYGTERGLDQGSLAAHAARRLALGLGSILALVLVGFAWTRLGAERAFAGPGGWMAWAAALLLAAALCLRRRAPAATCFSARLGAEPGPLPAMVFLLLAAVFATDAALTGDRTLGLAALGPVLTLLWVAQGEIGGGLLSHLEENLRAALGRAEGLTARLMKPRNGEPWLPEERPRLRHELASLARWAPALAVFLLPAGILLLPACAWFLDRRRRPRITTPPEHGAIPGEERVHSAASGVGANETAS